MEEFLAALSKLGATLDATGDVAGCDPARVRREARRAAPEWLLVNPGARKGLAKLLAPRRGTLTAWLAGGWREVEVLEACAGNLKVRTADGAMAGEVTEEQVHPSDRRRARKWLARLEKDNPLGFSDGEEFARHRRMKGESGGPE
jgi:hypothetical protein